MTAFVKNSAALAVAFGIAWAGPSFAQDLGADSAMSHTDKPVVAQPVSYNGYSCDMVRAKVAESGVVAAYAYARTMGLSHRDIVRVRKACSV